VDIDKLDELQQRLGVTFKRPDWLQQALAADDVTDGPGGASDHGRLEYLGDSVLNLCIKDLLFETQDEHEGLLTVRYSQMTSNRQLAKVSRQLKLPAYILRYHEQEEAQPVVETEQRWKKDADVVEAVVGAIFRDQGYEVARTVVERHIWPRLQLGVQAVLPLSPKALLYEHTTRKWGQRPHYRMQGRQPTRGPGPALYIADVYVGDQWLGRGKGVSLWHAECEAARQVLVRKFRLTSEQIRHARH
jgi:ribonuclease-3